MFPEHPPPGLPHPWTDPLEPPDFVNPRPDAALNIAGPLAPAPDQFPLTEEGKREYYEAVRRTAYHITMQEHLVMQHHLAATQAGQGDERMVIVHPVAATHAGLGHADAAERTRNRRRHLLLLRGR